MQVSRQKIIPRTVNSKYTIISKSIIFIALQLALRGPFSRKWTKIFKIDFIALKELRWIQLQFATNRIKISTLEQEVQPAKGCISLGLWRHRPAAGNNIIGSKSVRRTRNSRRSVTIQTSWEEDVNMWYSSARQLCYYPSLVK